MPNGVLAKDVKFLGVVQSFNEQKKYGLVASDEAQAMWGQEIYAYKDVLASCDAGVGDTIRFGIHVNPRGQPQVSLPVWKCDEMGFPIGAPEDATMVNAEEAVAQDPTFLEQLKNEIEGRSAKQNQKRGLAGSWGPAAKKGRMMDMFGDFAWGFGAGKGGKGKGWNPEVTLFVGGLPQGVEKREVAHIFRQYAGFVALRLAPREDHTIAFVTFASPPQAEFVCTALQGYVFDEEAEQPSVIQVTPAKNQSRGGGGAK